MTSDPPEPLDWLLDLGDPLEDPPERRLEENLPGEGGGGAWGGSGGGFGGLGGGPGVFGGYQVSVGGLGVQ